MDRVVWPVVILLLGSGFLAGGCQPVSSAVPYSIYDQPQLWAILKDEPIYAVITASNWQMYYPSVPPEADFGNNLYVVASWGARPNAGFRISVIGITQFDSTVQVRLKLEGPDPGKVYADVITHPTAIARINKSSLRPQGALSFEFLDQNGNKIARTEVNT